MTWTSKDVAAELSDEMTGAGGMGFRANDIQFISEPYTGPSWNMFVSVWDWARKKLKKRKS
jgi:hypothetical protein